MFVGRPDDVAAQISQHIASLPCMEVQVMITTSHESRRSHKPKTPQELLGSLPDAELDRPLCSIGADKVDLIVLAPWGINVIGDLWNGAQSWTGLDRSVQQQLAPVRDRLIAQFGVRYANCL